MIKFYCIDDDKDFLEKFKYLIVKYSFKKNIDITTLTSTVIPENLPSNIDAFFLDVEIGEQKIFPFVEKIRNENLSIPIIIMSNYDFYVMDSVKYNIFDYIRKRRLIDEINITLDKVTNYLHCLLPRIIFNYMGDLISIQIRDIYYVQLFSHKIKIITNKKTYEVNKDFKHVFADYCKYLIQVHKSYYINPCYLKSLKNDSVILEKNILVPLGMKYKKNIRTYFIKQFAHF